MSNGDFVHPTPVTAWQLIGGVISIVAVMVVALWTVVTNENANNKAITDDLRTNYTTGREHTDLVNRVSREVERASLDNKRIEEVVKTVHETTLTRAEFSVWKIERTRNIDLMQKQIEGMTSRVEQVVRDRASVESIASIQKQIDQLAKQIGDLTAREDQRHIGKDR